jgi:hypothetical protein
VRMMFGQVGTRMETLYVMNAEVFGAEEYLNWKQSVHLLRYFTYCITIIRVFDMV